MIKTKKFGRFVMTIVLVSIVVATIPLFIRYRLKNSAGFFGGVNCLARCIKFLSIPACQNIPNNTAVHDSLTQVDCSSSIDNCYNKCVQILTAPVNASCPAGLYYYQGRCLTYDQYHYCINQPTSCLSSSPGTTSVILPEASPVTEGVGVCLGNYGDCPDGCSYYAGRCRTKTGIKGLTDCMNNPGTCDANDSILGPEKQPDSNYCQLHPTDAECNSQPIWF